MDESEDVNGGIHFELGTSPTGTTGLHHYFYPIIEVWFLGNSVGLRSTAMGVIQN